MHFDPEIFDKLCHLIAEEFVADPHRLTPDTEVIELELDQEEYHRLYQRMAEETGVRLNDIIHSMPIYSLDEGETTMISLQNWAAFNPDAADYLDRCDVRTEKETLGSIAASFTAGEYVSSGQFFEPLYPPRSKRYVIGWAIFILGMGFVIIPHALAYFKGCNLACVMREEGHMDRVFEILPLTGGLALVLLTVAFVPGWLALRSRRRRAARRRL